MDDQDLNNAVTTVDAANALVTPLARSLENLLKLAAAALDSDEASIIVRQHQGDDLYFLAATGKVADKLRGVTIPAGKGIAGFVFSSGQPIAIQDAGQDENFYAEVDRQTGYSTQTILATPLRLDSEIVGVLEFVNRTGEPPFAPFTPDEMDKAAVYADALAALVDANESAGLIGALAGKLKDKVDLREWLRTVRASQNHREMLELAVLVGEVASSGDAERRFAREVLQSFLKFTKSSTAGESFLNF